MIKKKIGLVFIVLLLIGCVLATSGCTQEQEELLYSNNNNQTTMAQENYVIVDTGQNSCYDNSEEISYPEPGEPFYGQDAQYNSNQPSYQDNGDGTITDLVTGLMWTQDQSSRTMRWGETFTYCESLTTGGYTDWRMPTVKELWSIRDFSTGWPWVDTTYFYLTGDGTEKREHHSWTSDLYLIESEYQNEQLQGDPAWIVNDWTGHIKAMSGARFVRAVRGTTSYGINDFVDNGDGTVSDHATGLMWSQDDNGEHLYWEEALAYAEAATIAGYADWRLPNIKELQSIADYSVEVIPAMDTSVFNLTEVTNIIYDLETGDVIDTQVNYPFYWSSTSNPPGAMTAWFLASGYNTFPDGYDLHGAGSVCFGAKSEENAGVENSVELMVRLVRGGLNDNQAPEKPETPNGPTSGETGTEYSYTTSTNDPEGEQLYYWFNWGDDTDNGWFGPYDSEDEVTTSHTWDSKGSFEIKVKAKDTNGVQSEWSDPLPISMPKSGSSLSQIYQYFEENPMATMVAGGIGIALLFIIWKILS